MRACMHASIHITEEDAHGVWVTDVVSTKPAPYFALSCLTRRESICHPRESINRWNDLTPYPHDTAFSCFQLSWERAFPLSQTNHVRSMERLKRIMEHDELEGA